MYRLRSDVRLERDPAAAAGGGGWRAVDPALARAIKLGDSDARLLQALAGGATPATLARQLRQTPEEIHTRLAALARLYLLQGKRAQLRVALQAERTGFAKQLLQPAQAEPLEWLTGADPPRHACQGTGTCCGATFLGPLTDADAARVRKLTFGTRLGPAQHGQAAAVLRLGVGEAIGPEQILESVHRDGREYLGMARGQDEHCLAQGQDLLCDIHREHGSAAKPVACRLFPLRFYRSPLGIHVSLLLACDGYQRARAAAGAWPEREPEIRALLQEGAPAPRLTLPFELTPGLPLSSVEWWQLRSEFQAAEPQQADAHAWLLAIVERAHLEGQRRSAALAEGSEIDILPRLEGLAQALAQPQTTLAPQRTAECADQLDQRSHDLLRRGARHDAERLADLRLAVLALQDGLALAPRGNFSATAEALRQLSDVVANDVQAHIALGHLDAGLRTLTRRLLVVEALACSLARRAGRAEVAAPDTTRALHVVYRSEPDIAAL